MGIIATRRKKNYKERMYILRRQLCKELQHPKSKWVKEIGLKKKAKNMWPKSNKKGWWGGNDF